MSQPLDAELRRYLLGRTSTDEAARLEDRYAADPDLLARLEDAEDDLVREYLAGTLPADDRDAFDRTLASLPSRRVRLETVRGLMAHAAPAARARRAVPWWALAAAAAVVLAVGLRWRTPGPDQAAPQAAAPAPAAVPPGAETPPVAPPATGAPAAPAAPAPSPAARVAPPVVLALGLPATRAAGAPPTATVPRDTSAVVLRLEDVPELAAGWRAEVRNVDTDGTWRGVVDAPGAGAPPTARGEVRVPAASLPPGDYVLSAGPAAPADAPPSFRAYFRVERP